MENFIVSARKYRPSTFDMVVGQKSITGTLKNAVRTKQLAHAFLFCGPRGVGKTTCARIFSKTINCENSTPEGEACNECESCQSFNESRSYNIHELDAASNNSVDDIRSLIEQVRIPPQIGTHSVYIIDEVHMLSSAAFNAFLKTLEEPPSHAIFVMATTEKHKILPTILSRCQIFDFNRIKVKDIAEQLAYVAQRENIECEPAALQVIAQKADGGMRDALSYFDQIASFADRNITYQSAIQNLNVLDYEYYFKLVDFFLAADISETLLVFNDILNHGFDSQHFISGLNRHIRDLLVAYDGKTVELLEVTDDTKQQYLEQAKNTGIQFLFKALQITNQCEISFKSTQNQRLHVELALMNLCNLSPKSILSIVEKQTEQVKQNVQVESKEKVQPQEKPKAKVNLSPPSALNTSIGNVLNAEGKTLVRKEKKQVEDNQERNAVFTQEQLLDAWKYMVESVQASSPLAYNLVNSVKPLLKDDYVVEIPLSSDFQKSTIEKARDILMSKLIEKLNNSKIKFAYNVSEKARPKSVYTNEDKFKVLNEKNEKLDQLRQRFNLDFG